MSRIMGRFLLLAAAAALLFLPGAAKAQAPTGSITNIAPTGTGTLQATFSGTYAPSSTSFWYLSAYWRPIGSECLDDLGAIIWVSDASMFGPGTITETATFYPPTSQAFNICLYLDGPGNPYLLSLNSYWPPAPPPPAASPAPTSPPPAAAPADPAPIVIPLPLTSARGEATRALRRWWRGVRHHPISCRRTAENAAVCSSTWRRGRVKYRATVTVTRTGSDTTADVRVRRV